MDAFDADVLIYAASPGHPQGRGVRSLFAEPGTPDGVAGVGSVLLVPEVLSKPLREGNAAEIESLALLLGHLDLRPVDAIVADAAAALGATYGLRAADAVHLATAVLAGADRFITNNPGDFPKTIAEIEVCYPADLDG